MERALDTTSSVVEPQQPRWYAAHTRARHEKCVAVQLQRREVEAYLPLYTARHRWNKRWAHVELPLFSGYVFVHIRFAERLRVLEVPGVAHLVGSRGVATPLTDHEIEGIRQSLSRQVRAQPCEYLRAGDRVRVLSGPLEGLEGIVARQNGSARFIVSIDLIMRSISINVEGCDLEVVKAVS